MINLFKTNRNKATERSLDDNGTDNKDRFIKQAKIDQQTVLKSAATICKFFGSINEQLVRQNKLLVKDLKARRQDQADLKACFKTTADCQKQTAELANQSLERHALHPAILTIDLLAGLIRQMAQDAGALMKDHQLTDSVTPLTHSIVDAARIAKSKLSQLEIQMIEPGELDDLDSNLHEIANAVATDDPDKNRKVSQTLTAGLSYRGKTLRMAKVQVYRFEAKKYA